MVMSTAAHKHTLGSTLESLRHKAGLSLEEAARQAQIDVRSLATVESGRRKPWSRTLLRLAELYGVDVNDLLEGIKLEAGGGQFSLEVEDKRYIEEAADIAIAYLQMKGVSRKNLATTRASLVSALRGSYE
jgi:transcriptional regulator with XRE-family HTH domain